MKRVGCRNKFGINKAAQLWERIAKTFIMQERWVIQRSSEEVTGKVQKYARMDCKTICALKLPGGGVLYQ